MSRNYGGEWSRKLFQMLFDVVGNKYSVPTIIRTEANIRDGNQFFIDEIFTSIASNTSVFILLKFQKDVVVTKRILTTNMTNIYYRCYFSPSTTSNGSSAIVKNYNRVDPTPTDTVAFRAPSITNNGSMFVEDWFPGSEGQGNRLVGAIGEDGVVRIIPAGNYLVEIRNTSDSTGRAQLSLSWSEGNIYNIMDDT